MKHNYDDTFLARWVSNELTTDELSEFKNSEDFELYNKIIEKSSLLSTTNFDKQKMLNNIKSELANKKEETKVIKLNRWIYSAAASIAILFSVFYFFNNKKDIYSTDFGEQLAVTLPDDSEVTLNAKSTLKFDSDNWNSKREVKLNGEAFFKVTKGQKFTVASSQGKVQVLGTQFNVRTEEDYFEVKCFEGKVRVLANNFEKVLTKGMGVRVLNNTINENISFDYQSTNTWNNGESSFKSTPLSKVVKSIENQFNIKIKAPEEIDLNQRFTGSFTHKDLKIALKTVFVPMKIDVIFTDEKTVSLVKK